MPSEFLLAYRDLIKIAKDDPANLAERADADSALQNACERLEKAAMELFIAERYSATRYAHDIPKTEIDAVNDYDRRWRRAVARASPFLRGVIPSGGPVSSEDPERERIRDAVDEAAYIASKFEGLIDFAREHASGDDESEFYEWAFEALSVWDDLRIRTQFNLQDVLARLELVPFVRVPTGISRKHGAAETISLFQRLQDAQRAFVFGCYLSSAAMQRAILEDLLPPGDKLPRRIERASLSLPMKKGLFEISTLGNDVLHADRQHRVQNLDRTEILLKLVRGLHTLKELIEEAPFEPAT